MTKLVIALCMFLNGELMEHAYRENISDCLKSKRIAERNTGDNVRWMCGEVEAIVEEDWNSGSIRIIDIKQKDEQ